jgi:NADH dehydrogenase
MDARDAGLDRPPNGSRPRVVIVGGGFGGLYAARGLAGASVQLTVVDQHNYHLFRPLLYQVATGLLSADEIAAPIRSILHKQKNTEVLMAEVIGVDAQHQRVQTREGSLPYDYLILATGSHYNYFGHDEWVTLAPGLHSADDADFIRGKILRAFEDAERLANNGQADHDTLQALLTFVLVGGGTAGVEMAGTIAEMARMTLVNDFRHIDPRSARVVLFEAAPRILPGYPEHLSTRAHRHLEQLGVEVRTNTKVEAVDATGVTVVGEPIYSHTVVWTAGVLASPAGQWLGVETDRSGRVKVLPDFSVPGHPNVFAIGDTALAVAPTRNLFGIRSREPVELPGVAQPAIQAGRYVASVIRRRVEGLPPPAPFCYWDKGSLAIVGRTFAVADVPPFRFWGVPAWLVWLGVHIYALIGFANRLLVMLQWGLSFLTKRRGVRILSRRQLSLEEE